MVDMSKPTMVGGPTDDWGGHHLDQVPQQGTWGSIATRWCVQRSRSSQWLRGDVCIIVELCHYVNKNS